MTKHQEAYPRGSEWRIWDMHVHSPASFHWNGQRFRQMSPAEKKAAVDQMINAFNNAPPAVFVLMDYWTFDGWFALNERLRDADAPVLNKKVFPGIELRLVSPTSYRLNAHALFSDDVTDQQLRDFRSGLHVELVERPLSDESLIELVRTRVQADWLIKHGFNKRAVDADDEMALQAGATIAEVRADSYKAAIANAPKGKAIGFMPWETSDGLAKADWQTHYAFVIGLMQASPIFETRKDDLWAAFVGEETPGNKGWLASFQGALNNVPRLAVSGSDAHRFADYGAFPSGKATWIKGDPTFRGLLQAIKEPARRSYIGALPPKIQEVSDNKTYFIDSLTIGKISGSTLTDHWFDGCKIPLNPDLVAIIGNKGSGKSALADVVALLGNSKSSNHFSFLSTKRFRQQPSVLAKNFSAQITWKDGSVSDERILAQNPPVESPELVRYIPQAFFEDLCNSHVSGKSNAFERELRSVIFAHTTDAERQGAHDFDQLLHVQEQAPRDALAELRKELQVINEDIERIEDDLAPEKRKATEQLLALKEKELQEHEKTKPATKAPPAAELTPEQKVASEEINRLSVQLDELATTERALAASATENVAKQKAVEAVRERVKLFKRQVRQLQDETSASLTQLGLKAEDIITLRIDETQLDAIEAAFKQSALEFADKVSAIAPRRMELNTAREALKSKLNELQQAYQQYVAAVKAWEEKRAVLIGNGQIAESLEGYKARLAYQMALPKVLSEKQAQRRLLAGEILAEITKQREVRAALFKPVQNVIDGNKLIRDDYKLQFKAALTMSTSAFSERLFSIMKQNFGAFNGEAESHNEVQRIVETHDIDTADGALGLIDELMEKIMSGAQKQADSVGVSRIMRVNRKASELYDFLFGFEFIEPRYTLLFQDTQIEHLSPGQRGALLLIFYLLVDTGHNPIILDQPEENLDNETLVSLLVPVLSEAKKHRQIIMVTHNPNLAVVCDAEQIIYSAFDRKNNCQITYTSGAIESPQINRHVVNVLEGTKMAFDNRGRKYH